MDLKTYIDQGGHGALARLAKMICAHVPDVSSWASGKRQVPVVRATAIELATEGAVTRRDLRPDDWHLIWPELADAAPLPNLAAKEAA